MNETFAREYLEFSVHFPETELIVFQRGWDRTVIVYGHIYAARHTALTRSLRTALQSPGGEL